jgi:peptidylprolyl isomerase
MRASIRLYKPARAVRFLALFGSVCLAACNTLPGTPAFRPVVTPATLAPRPTTPPNFKAVNVGEGLCVGVGDPKVENLPASGKDQRWDAAPALSLVANQVYCAIITTSKGRMVLQLYPEVAPQHVNSFIFLARQGFYDNQTFHRVLKDFMAQGGDPLGTGVGGPGYSIPLETSAAARFDKVGVLGMARSQDPNSAGSQFFITFAAQPSLDPGVNGAGYTVFGQLVEGLSVLQAITLRNPDENPNFVGDSIVSIRIVDQAIQ